MPLRPEDMPAAKAARIPDMVIAVFDELITAAWNGSRAVVQQNDAVVAIMEACGLNRAEVFERKYLDVEDVYRGAGWKVVYDKPAYNETYEAHFVFSAK